MSLEQTENVLPIINRAGKRQLMAGNGNRLILWSLFSITFGYRYPKKSEELSSDSVMPQGRVTDYFIHD